MSAVDCCCLSDDFLLDFLDDEATELTLLLRFNADTVDVDDDDEEGDGVVLELDDVAMLEGIALSESTSSSQNFFFRRSLLPDTAAIAGPSSNLGLPLHPLSTFGVVGAAVSL